MTKLFQAAVMTLTLLAVAGLTVLLRTSGGPACALEQTIEPAKDTRSFHLQFLNRGAARPDREAWVDYDPNGVLRHVRVNYYGSNDVAVWSDGTGQYWRRGAKELWIYEDKEDTDKILFFARRYDPRHALTYLQREARQEEVRITVGPLDDSTHPMTATVTYDPNTFLLGKQKPRMRELFRIDPATKLIVRVDVETFQAQGYVRVGAWEYFDCNQPCDPKIFDLRHEVPADVNVSDTTRILMGVEQGPLCDEEVAVRVVREFLEAWAAKDYDRAVQIHGYLALGETKGIREKLLLPKDIRRVISVGPPTLPARPLTGLLVPCQVEYEENGQAQTGPLTFRTSEGPRGRWRIRDPQ